MSYNYSRATEYITVSYPIREMKISISSSSPWYTGDTYTITVWYHIEGITSRGNTTEKVKVPIYIKYSNGDTVVIYADGELYTQMNGVSMTAKVEWIPQENYGVDIYSIYDNFVSNHIYGIVIAKTKISGVSISPSTKLFVKEKASISGELEYYEKDTWKPLPNQEINVSITSNKTVISSYKGITDKNGYFNIDFTAPSSPGSYAIIVYYKGSNGSKNSSIGSLGLGAKQYFAPSMKEFVLNSVGQEIKKKLNTQTIENIIYTVSALAGVIVSAYTIYKIVHKK